MKIHGKAWLSMTLLISSVGCGEGHSPPESYGEVHQSVKRALKKSLISPQGKVSREEKLRARQKKNAQEEALSVAALDGDLDTVLQLLNRGVSPNTTDKDERNTPLYFAMVELHNETVEALLNAGGDPSKVNKKGRNALHDTVLGSLSATLLERIFTDFPGALNQQDRDGETPLHVAVRRHDPASVRLLLQAGANTTLEDKFEDIAFDEILANYNGTGPLQEILYLFLDSPQFVLSKQQATALLFLASQCNDIPLMERCVAAGAQINHTRNSDGLAPLHVALVAGHFEAALWLKNHGADMHLVDQNKGMSPRNFAVMFDEEQLQQLFDP